MKKKLYWLVDKALGYTVMTLLFIYLYEACVHPYAMGILPTP